MDELDELVRRLRGLTASGWRRAGRAELVRKLAADLVLIGGEGHSLPDVPDYVLGDVIAVAGADAWFVDAVATRELVSAAGVWLR